MRRYIDADKIEYFTTIVGSDEFAGYKNIAFKEDIDEIPTADVVEVRHGKWNEDIFGFYNVCMECGAIVERTAIKNSNGKLNYCPNCGAKMDAESEGEG